MTADVRGAAGRPALEPPAAAVPPGAPSREPPPESPRRLRRSAMFVAPIVGIAVVFAVWELYVRVFDISRLTLPTPSSIVVHLVEEPSFYWRHAQVTMLEAFWGYLLALVAALIVATFMAHSRFVERASLPVIVLLQSTPVAVLAPVFLIWFGFSIWPKVLIATVFCYIPFTISEFTGLRSVDPNAYELLRSVSASRVEIFWRLRFPQSLPYLFSAGRLCVGLSLVGAVIGEMFGGSTEGLGNTARVGQTRLLIDQLWGSIFALALIGVLANLLLATVETRVLRWHSSQDLRSGSTTAL